MLAWNCAGRLNTPPGEFVCPRPTSFTLIHADSPIFPWSRAKNDAIYTPIILHRYHWDTESLVLAQIDGSEPSSVMMKWIGSLLEIQSSTRSSSDSRFVS